MKTITTACAALLVLLVGSSALADETTFLTGVDKASIVRTACALNREVDIDGAAHPLVLQIVDYDGNSFSCSASGEADVVHGRVVLSRVNGFVYKWSVAVQIEAPEGSEPVAASIRNVTQAEHDRNYVPPPPPPPPLPAASFHDSPTMGLAPGSEDDTVVQEHERHATIVIGRRARSHAWIAPVVLGGLGMIIGATAAVIAVMRAAVNGTGSALHDVGFH